MKGLNYIAIIVLSVLGLGVNAQSGSETGLFKTLQEKDSVLFDAAFNRCGIATLNSIFTEDFEFYHDKSGITEGKETFVGSIANDCNNRDKSAPQPAKRILIPGSLEVYPLYKNGELYGAIQHGIHRFEFLNERGEYQKGDIAKFTHVWILDEGQWKVKRELSYDHQLQQ
jgi:hypothetical protein